MTVKHDIFISHASEDKLGFVRPLVKALAALGLQVWYDEDMIKPGDSIAASIDRGLRDSHHAIIVLSPSFLKKRWTKWEMRALVQRLNSSGKRKRGKIIPVWHDITYDVVQKFSPTLADIAAFSSSDGADMLADKIRRVISPRSSQAQRNVASGSINPEQLVGIVDALQQFLRMVMRSEQVLMSVTLVSEEHFGNHPQPRRGGLTDWVLKNGRTGHIEVDQSHLAYKSRFLERESVKSMVAVPFPLGPDLKPIGVMMISTSEAALFEREKGFLLDMFAPMAAKVLHAIFRQASERPRSPS